MPNALALNLRIETEGRCAGCGKTEIDGIAVFIAGEAKPKVDRMLSPGTLDGMLPTPHGVRDGLRSGPQG